VVSTSRLDGIEAWEPDDLTLVVGAGAKVAEVEEMLSGANQTAVMPEHPGRATIGGVLAAGISSLRRSRLLGTRERVLEVTVVTGDGRIVRAGGRVVKNVTGYDLARLHVGAFGSLGVIVSVCLKLWPTPPAAVTISLDDPLDAALVTRPLALLEQAAGHTLYYWGTDDEVAAVVARVPGRARPGLDWPSDPVGDYRWSLRVPPADLGEAVSRLPPRWGYLALHGVGEARLASSDADGAEELRAWAESIGGRLVIASRPPDDGTGLEPWGADPAALPLQRRLIAEFDPARVINPGRLPGGL
jgi:glycolate oxidase FAD binding subunit